MARIDRNGVVSSAMVRACLFTLTVQLTASASTMAQAVQPGPNQLPAQMDRQREIALALTRAHRS